MTDKCPTCGGTGSYEVPPIDSDDDVRLADCPDCAGKPAPVSSVDVEDLVGTVSDCWNYEWGIELRNKTLVRIRALGSENERLREAAERAQVYTNDKCRENLELEAENERLRELVRGLVPRDLTKAGSWVVVDARAYRELQRAALEGKDD